MSVRKSLFNELEQMDEEEKLQLLFKILESCGDMERVRVLYLIRDQKKTLFDETPESDSKGKGGDLSHYHRF